MEKIKTLCPYCGVGCSFYLKVENGRVVGVEPWEKDPISKGKPCIKGLNSYQTIYRDRIKKPMIRINEKLKTVTWEEAYRFIYKNIKNLNKNEIAFYGSSPSSNEDNYLMQKFAREIFKTENIDSCARLCHAATCYAFFNSFGITRMPAKIEDFAKADTVLIIGSNPKATYPVAFQKIKGKLICVTPWKEETAENADLFICIEDGTDTAFLNGILNLLNVKLPKFMSKIIKRYTPKTVAKICKIKKNDLIKASKIIKKSKRFVLGFGMGITQHVYGVNNVYAAINLTLAKKGKIISMRGKANIQGVGDMGCLPRAGGNTMINSVFFEPVKALYIMESNPAQSLPELNKAHVNLRNMFVILHTSYPNLTMKKYANVILPCTSWAERSGTFTNAESQIRWFNKAIEPLYNSKPNWIIYTELSRYFKKKWNYKKEEDVLQEITKKIKGYNLSINKIKKEGGFVNYKVLKKEYHAVEYIEAEDKRSDNYPFLLTTARSAYHFCTGEMSRRSKTLTKLVPEAYCWMNAKDAKELNVKNKASIKVESDIGKIKVKAIIDKRIPRKLVIVPFHFEEVLVNKLIPLEFSPQVEEPNLKKVAVRIKKI